MRIVRTLERQPSLTRDDSGPVRISGYASVFYRSGEPRTEFELWDGFRERIMPGAFDRALSEQHDVRALLNHDANHVLGRTSSGTLTLAADDIGLRYEVDLPDTQSGKDVATLVERGDITGASFAFELVGQERRHENGIEVREITDVNLYDVGPVTYPAYTATTAEMRSIEREEWERERDKKRQQQIESAWRERTLLLKPLSGKSLLKKH